ncbi:MAG: hypothetical protein E7157_01700 [Lactobacillales bacterium]|nr:hypothetical protein [Lactobacillales bacterium]
MEEKKNKLIVFLIGIIILLVGVIIFVVLNKQEEPKKEQKEETKIEETEDKVTETREYYNFQKSEIDFSLVYQTKETKYENATFYIENKNLKAKSKNTQFNITGLTGNIKSFTYNELCGETPILAINENNEVFYTIIDEEDKNFEKGKIVFNKLDTKEKIINITFHVDTTFSEGCGPSNLAVVLENGEIRSFDYDESKKVTIGKKDYSIYLESLNGNILIFKDGTIQEIFLKETIKYKNKDFKADKIYLVKDEPIDDESKYLELEYYKVHYYIISNDKLYKLTLDYSTEEIKYNVVLVSDKKVTKTTTTNKGLTEDENYDPIKETITFEDNTTKVINADSIYVIK